VNDASPGTAQQDSRPPRGALIVVAVGLLACVVAAVAATGKGEGEAAELEWVQKHAVADSSPVRVPGGRGQMQLVETDIMATGTNVSGYSLFRIASMLRISAGAPIGGSRILCSITARRGTEIAQSSGGLRATYPRSSEGGIFKQEVPETVLIDFSSHSNELAVLEVLGMPSGFTSEKGVKVEWPEYQVGKEQIKYFITGKPKQELVLPFFTVWKTTDAPSAKIACALTTSAGGATAQTQASLKKQSPPIDEEAEALRAEEREEAEESEEEG
jgi:hypothetical protein